MKQITNRLDKLKLEEYNLNVEIRYIELMLEDQNKLTTREQDIMDALGIDLDFDSRLQCKLRDLGLIVAEIKLLEEKLFNSIVPVEIKGTKVEFTTIDGITVSDYTGDKEELQKFFDEEIAPRIVESGGRL